MSALTDKEQLLKNNMTTDQVRTTCGSGVLSQAFCLCRCWCWVLGVGCWVDAKSSSPWLVDAGNGYKCNT